MRIYVCEDMHNPTIEPGDWLVLWNGRAVGSFRRLDRALTFARAVQEAMPSTFVDVVQTEDGDTVLLARHGWTVYGGSRWYGQIGDPELARKLARLAEEEAGEASITPQLEG